MTFTSSFILSLLSLDVELQKERSDRMKLEVKVMSPRSAQASMMLPETAREESPEESTPFLTRSSVISFQDLYVIVLKMRKFLCTYNCPTICILYFLVWGFIVYYLLSIRI